MGTEPTVDPETGQVDTKPKEEEKDETLDYNYLGGNNLPTLKLTRQTSSEEIEIIASGRSIEDAALLFDHAVVRLKEILSNKNPKDKAKPVYVG